jgi:hypothetical protein
MLSACDKTLLMGETRSMAGEMPRVNASHSFKVNLLHAEVKRARIRSLTMAHRSVMKSLVGGETVAEDCSTYSLSY